MVALAYGLSDCFKALKTGWSSRKISVAFKGLLTAWSIYFVFSYLALILDGGMADGFPALFRKHEFFPLLGPFLSGIIPAIIWSVGVFLSGTKVLLTASTVSRIAFQDFRGHDVYQVSEAKDYTKTMRRSIVIAAFFPLLLGIVMTVPAGIAGLIGRIPAIGPVIIALLAIPLLFWLFAAVCVLIVFINGLWLLPSIAAASGGDTLEIIIESFSMTLKRPIMQMLYQITARIVVLIAFAVLSTVSFCVFLLFTGIFGTAMGLSFSKIFVIAIYRLPGFIENPNCWYALWQIGYALKVPLIIDTSSAGPALLIAGWIFGIMLLIIKLWLFSYIFSVFHSAQLLIYLGMKKRLSGEDIRTRNDIDYFVPEKID